MNDMKKIGGGLILIGTIAAVLALRGIEPQWWGLTVSGLFWVGGALWLYKGHRAEKAGERLLKAKKATEDAEVHDCKNCTDCTTHQ
jgi:hypothetical protein